MEIGEYFVVRVSMWSTKFSKSKSQFFYGQISMGRVGVRVRLRVMLRLRVRVRG